MGVNGIWEYIQRHALKISAHSLRNKKLAIDGHIWLFESLKGSAAHGVAATHIATFFNRCSRLRELGIEPIVVFDNYSKDFKSHNSEHVKKSKRGGASQKLSDLVSFKQKIDEICELLTAMGVRWLIAINQGEAQCAQLEQAGLVDGCITSDFDYLLFGGKNIYRLEFIQGGRSVREEVRHFSLDNLFETMKLNRERLVALAMLLGCDYFQGGIERIGVVRGLEIISEFAMVEDDHPVTILDRFYSYSMQEVPGRNTDSEVRRKLRRASFSFPTGFPNGEMFLDSVNAYLQPEVYIYKELPQKNLQSAENVEKLLIKFCNWNADKVQETFERIEKKSKLNKANATKLTTFYTPSRRRSSSRTAVVTECSPEDSASCSRREWAALKTLRSKALLCPKHDDEEPRPTTIKAKRPRPTTKGAPARKRRPPPRHIANSVVEIDDTSSSVQILD